MKNLLKKIVLLGCVVSPLAFADDAPVVSITPINSANSTDAANPAATNSTSTLTLDQRVAVLERQISAMNQIDLVNEMSRVEQQIQDLQGQVQVLSHTLQTVQSQTTSQYADLDKRLSDAQPTATPATTTSTTIDSKASSNSTDSAEEQKLYDSAYKNIREQKNAAGLAGMKKYLDKYPDGPNAPNAHYWLGQIYLLKGDDKSIKDAVGEFDTVIKKYPKSDKSKEASLKLGFAYLLQNKNTDAKLQFKKVIKEYPGTSVAKLAEARLAQLS